VYIAEILSGRKLHPISDEGDNDKWKKAQNKLKKNITSVIINKIIAKRILPLTKTVWFLGASIRIALNQEPKLKENNKVDKIKCIGWNSGQ
jgi:hypothetical protein